MGKKRAEEVEVMEKRDGKGRERREDGKREKEGGMGKRGGRERREMGEKWERNGKRIESGNRKRENGKKKW